MSKPNKKVFRMKNLVDISTMVTQSSDFFSIKDKIIDKMLEVVHPTKVCVNLFYDDNYDYAYLVCSQTLEYIPTIFNNQSKKGIKIDFNEYPKYVHEVVKTKQNIYIKNIFEDDRTIKERELAKIECYVGRIVFPFVINDNVVGFMTCFLTENDSIDEQDIDFISSVASLIGLSINITMRNQKTDILIRKLRGAIVSINEATKKLYQNKNINEFLDHLSKQACHITKSKESMILIDKTYDGKRIFSAYSLDVSNQSNIYPIMDEIRLQKELGIYNNKRENCEKIKRYVYYTIKDKKEILGYIVCANANNYTSDDLNILSILARQIYLAMKLFEYNLESISHKVLSNELKLLNEQQSLLMNGNKVKYSKDKELDFYHKPAKVVGGDFYYSVQVDENRLVYIVADVMGHGIVSNYVVAIIKGAFKVLAKTCATSGEILTNINNMLYDEFDKMGVFTTALVAVVDSSEKTISISNAGHYSPTMIDKKGNIKRGIKCKKGIPIGIMEDAVYDNNVFNLEEIPMIWMYTDGILEVRNQEKEEYGVERLESFIQCNFRNEYNTIVENIQKELLEFSNKENYDDDILVVMLRNQ